MSLINDALKKAQRQRTGESPPPPPPAPSEGLSTEPVQRIPRRAKPPGFDALLVRIGIGAAAGLAVVIGGFFAVRAVLNRPATPPPTKPAIVSEAKPPTTTPAPAIPVAPPARPAPAPTASSTKSTPTEFVVPFTTPPAAVATPAPVNAPSSAPIQTNPAPAVAEKKAPIAAPAVPPPAEPIAAKPPEPPPKMQARAVGFIENLRVAGIRASATDSKVLMNDRVYRVGDTVEHEMGIKITGITSGSLSFEDERGAKYTRQF